MGQCFPRKVSAAAAFINCTGAQTAFSWKVDKLSLLLCIECQQEGIHNLGIELTARAVLKFCPGEFVRQSFPVRSR